MAFNQGFYNLFLALGVGLGLVLHLTGTAAPAGIALVLFALASMLLAALVLLASNPRMVRPALIQGAAPALAIASLAAAIIL
jgi:putative membrane protein